MAFGENKVASFIKSLNDTQNSVSNLSQQIDIDASLNTDDVKRQMQGLMSEFQRLVDDIKKEFSDLDIGTPIKNSINVAQTEIGNFINFIDSNKDKLSMRDISDGATRNIKLITDAISELKSKISEIGSTELNLKFDGFMGSVGTAMNALDTLKDHINDFNKNAALVIDGSQPTTQIKTITDQLDGMFRTIHDNKDTAKQSFTDMFNGNVPTTALNQISEALKNIGEQTTNLANKNLGDTFNGAFEAFNQETINLLKQFSEILGEINETSSQEINNPFGDLADSLEKIAANRDAITELRGLIGDLKDGSSFTLPDFSSINNELSGIAQHYEIIGKMFDAGNLSQFASSIQQMAESMQQAASAMQNFNHSNNPNFSPDIIPMPDMGGFGDAIKNLNETMRNQQQTQQDLIDTMQDMIDKIKDGNNSPRESYNHSSSGPRFLPDSDKFAYAPHGNYDQMFASSQRMIEEFFNNRKTYQSNMTDHTRDLSDHLWQQKNTLGINEPGISEMLTGNNNIETLINRVVEGAYRSAGMANTTLRSVGTKEANDSFDNLKEYTTKMGNDLGELLKQIQDLQNHSNSSAVSVSSYTGGLGNGALDMMHQLQKTIEKLPAEFSQDFFKNGMGDVFKQFEDAIRDINRQNSSQMNAAVNNGTFSSRIANAHGHTSGDAYGAYTQLLGQYSGLPAQDQVALFGDVSRLGISNTDNRKIQNSLLHTQNLGKRLDKSHQQMEYLFAHDDQNLMGSANNLTDFAGTGLAFLQGQSNTISRLHGTMYGEGSKNAGQSMDIISKLSNQSATSGKEIKEIVENAQKALEAKAALMNDGDEKSALIKQLETTKKLLEDINTEMTRTNRLKTDTLVDMLHMNPDEEIMKQVDQSRINYFNDSQSRSLNNVSQGAEGLSRSAHRANMFADRNKFGAFGKNHVGFGIRNKVDDIAGLATNISDEMAALEKARQEYEALMADANATDSQKRDAARAMSGKQQSINRYAQRLGKTAKVSKNQMDKMSPEVRKVFEEAKKLMGDVSDSNSDQVAINMKIGGLEDVNNELTKADGSINEMMEKIGDESTWNKIKDNIENFVVNPLKSAGDIFKTALGVMGLGTLGSFMSLTGLLINLPSKLIETETSQSRDWANTRKTEMIQGYGPGARDNWQQLMGQGIGLQESTYGMVNSGDYTNAYRSLVQNVRGHIGGSGAQGQQDMMDMTKMSTLLQDGMGIGEGQTNNAINTFYQEFRMNVHDTEAELAKIGQTAQSLNVPFAQHLQDVTNLAMQYKNVGLGADAANTVMGNLMHQYGMTETEANQAAQSLGNGLGNAPEGALAYNSMMLGMYNNPLDAVSNLKYKAAANPGKYQDQLMDVLDNQAKTYYAATGSSDYGLAKGLESMGITDKRLIGKIMEQYDAGNTDAVKNLLNQGMSGSSADKATDPGQWFIDQMQKPLQDAGNYLSGTDKTLNELDVQLKLSADAHKTEIDKITDFSKQIKELGGLFDKLLDKTLPALDDAFLKLKGLIDDLVTGNWKNLMNDLGIPKWGQNAITGVAGFIGNHPGEAAAIAGGTVAAGYLGKKAIQAKFKQRANQRQANTIADAIRERLGIPESQPIPEDLITEETAPRRPIGFNVEDVTPTVEEAGKSSSSLLESLRGKGKYGLLAAGAVAAGTFLFGGHAQAAGEATGGNSKGSDDIYNVLVDILSVLSGGTIGGGSGGSGGAAARHPITSLGWDSADTALLAGGFGASLFGKDPIAPAANKLGKNVRNLVFNRNTDKGLSESLTEGIFSSAGKSGARTGLSLLGDLSGPLLDVAGAGLFSAMDIHDADKVNSIVGLKTSGKEKTNIIAKNGTLAAIMAGAGAGGAIGAGFFGVGALPGALIGGIGAGAVDMLGGFNGIKNGVAGLFGASDKDVEKEKEKNSPGYKFAMDLMDRYKKQTGKSLDENTALYAGQGISKYASDVKGMNQQEKDNWALQYAISKMQGSSDENARKQADSLFQLNLSSGQLKQINQGQLDNAVKLYETSGMTKESLDAYAKQYGITTSKAHDILDQTSKDTGISKDKLGDIASQLGLLPQQLAALIQMSGGTTSKADLGDLKSKLKSAGLSDSQISKDEEFFLENKSMFADMSKGEMAAWVGNYGKTNSTSKADSAATDYRKANSVLAGKGGLIDTLHEDEKDAQWRRFIGYTELPSGMSASNVISNFAKSAGLSSGAVNQVMKDNNLNEDMFSKFLLGYDGSGKFNDKNTVNELVGNRLDNIKEISAKSMDQTAKDFATLTGTTAQGLKDVQGNQVTVQKQDQDYYGSLTADQMKADESNTGTVVDMLSTINTTLGSTVGNKLDHIESALKTMLDDIAAAAGSGGGIAAGGLVGTIAKIIGANEGDYNSVNGHDNGALSIGKMQWHGNRARDLIKDIQKLDPQAVAYGLQGTGLNLNDDWSHLTLNSSQSKAVSQLLDGDAGHQAQDQLIQTDINSYINHAKQLGVSDPQAVAFLADIENQGGAGAANRIVKEAGGDLSLNGLYNAATHDSVMGQYASRRQATFSAASGISSSGGDFGGATLDPSAIINGGGNSNGGLPIYNLYASTVNVNGTSISGSSGVSSMIDTSRYAGMSGVTGINGNLVSESNGLTLNFGGVPTVNSSLTGGNAAGWYLGKYQITSGFGDTLGRVAPHEGLDLDGKMGDPIKAVMGGKVISVDNGHKQGDGSEYGNDIVVQMADGTQALYGHLQNVGVKAGDTVNAGQLIGTMGNTGSTASLNGGDGSHLHLSYLVNGQNMDPLQWLNQLAGGNTTASGTGGGDIGGATLLQNLFGMNGSNGANVASGNSRGLGSMMSELSSLQGKGSSQGGLTYVWGGGHNTNSWDDFMKKAVSDCSGFVENVYRQFAGIDLGHGTADNVMRANNGGQSVGKSQLQTGDLVFFGSGGSASHVGIYAGNGQYYGMNETGHPEELKSLSTGGNFIEGKHFNIAGGGSALNIGGATLTNALTSSSVPSSASAPTQPTTLQHYGAVLSDIGANDPFSGINVRANLANNSAIFDTMHRLGIKDISESDNGVNLNSWQLQKRNAFDVQVQHNIDVANNPQFIKVLNDKLQMAFRDAINEVQGTVSSNIQDSFTNIWNSVANVAGATKSDGR